MPKSAAWREGFLKAVADKDSKAMKAAIAGGMPINGFALGDKNEHTPLHYLALNRDAPALVDLLIAAGADVNAVAALDSEHRPLTYAARRGYLAVIEKLLAAGADINAASSADVTALSCATGDKKPAHEAVVEYLLGAGAKPNYQALVGAARNGTPAMIEMLVAAGADVDEVSRWGTALVCAADKNREDSVETLLRGGADPHLRIPDTHKNFPGQTALDAAKKAKAKKVIPILEGALAGSVSIAPEPKPLDGVPKLWKRLDKALKANPGAKKSLKKGAAEEQIAACEKVVGHSFPDELRACYLIHDGQKAGADGLFPEEFVGLDSEFALLALEEIASTWTTWNDLANAGEFKKQKSQPDAGVRADWWNPKWLPFAGDGGGDSLCVDLAPAKGGTVGQVILLHHADAARTKKATGIRELLNSLAEYWEDS